MFKRKEMLEWLLAVILVIAGILFWHMAASPHHAMAGDPTDPCNSSGPTD